MVNKNYILIAGLCTALAVPTFGQETAVWSGRDMTYRGQSYDALDTAYIPDSRMEQQREYLDYKYAFPAKPRNMIELGVNAGLVNMFSDITSKTPFNSPRPLDALGFGLSVRKAWGYTMSWRVNYNFLNANGYDYRSRSGATGGDAFNVANGYNPNSIVYSNYKFNAHELTFQLVGAINNIKFHRAQNVVSLHGFVGAGAMLHRTLVSNRDANNNIYDFTPLQNQANIDDRNQMYKDWLNASEYNYLVEAPSQTNKPPRDRFIGDFYIDPVIVGGLGVQFKLGNRVSLQLEDKITWSGLDWIDGVQLDPQRGAGLSPDKDVLNYASVGLGFNLGNKATSVAPLWWVNPLDHVYNELAMPRHMQLPNVVLPDSDGDGVTDQFDKCPDTPLGVAVDANGCPLDTDGDGVPDYRDKELITPTNCQPVDADGVGDCPCDPDCGGQPVACANINAGIISFNSNSASLSNGAKSQLANLAAQMNANPTCYVVIAGNGTGSKLQQQRSWDRVNAVIEYMTDNMQISRDRFYFKYNTGMGDANSVTFRPANAGETGDSVVPPPHPQLGTNR